MVLFFVLSGFVLTLPQMAPRPQSYPAYVIRRICRIYLPYLAALALAVLGCWRFHGLERYGTQVNMPWRNPPSSHLVVAHLAFLGRYDVYAYDSPIWSLVHEMRISLIFPVLCLVSLRLRAWLAFLVALSLPVLDRIIERFSGPYLGGGYPGVQSVFWSYTVGFCGIFVVGSLLARYREPIIAWLARRSAWILSALSLVAFVLYQYASLLHIPRFLWDFVVGLGGAYFIMLALGTKWLALAIPAPQTNSLAGQCLLQPLPAARAHPAGRFACVVSQSTGWSDAGDVPCALIDGGRGLSSLDRITVDSPGQGPRESRSEEI